MIVYDNKSWGIVERLLKKWDVKPDDRPGVTTNNKVIAKDVQGQTPFCTGETVFALFLRMTKRIEELEETIQKMKGPTPDPIDIQKIDERFNKIEAELPIGFKELFFSFDKKLDELWSKRK